MDSLYFFIFFPGKVGIFNTGINIIRLGQKAYLFKRYYVIIKKSEIYREVYKSTNFRMVKR